MLFCFVTAFVFIAMTSCSQPTDLVVPNVTEEVQVVSGFISVQEQSRSSIVMIDASAIENALNMRFATTRADLETAKEIPFSPSIAFDTGVTSGLVTIHARFSNGSGSRDFAKTVRIDPDKPKAMFTINSGSAYVASSTLMLQIPTENDAIVMRFAESQEALSNEVWVPFSTLHSYTLTLSYGNNATITIWAEFKDYFGDTASSSQSVTYSTSSPGGYFLINDGNAYTKINTVLIDLSHLENCEKIKLANSSEELASAPWNTLSASVSWTLEGADGEKTVFLKAQAKNGNESEMQSNIILDTLAPDVPVPETPTSSTNDARPLWTWKFQPDAYQYAIRLTNSTDNTLISDWTFISEISYSPNSPLPLKNREYVLEIRAVDQAGNSSETAVSKRYVYANVSGCVQDINPNEGKNLYLLLLDGSNNQYGSHGNGAMQTPFSLIISASNPVFEFINVPDGDYIIVCFQDKDGNGKLSKGAFGAPTEKWGTYLGVSTTSLVSFADGHFTVSGQDTTNCNFKLLGFHW